jgi:mRNA interferase MazF
LLALRMALVAPTSRSAPARSFRPRIELEGETAHVLVEQMTAVSTDRLGESVGRLNAQELRAVDEALALVLGL